MHGIPTTEAGTVRGPLPEEAAMTRHLVGLIDGTMVSASRTTAYGSYSNVFELAYLLQLQDRSDEGGPQIVFYTSGISSQPDSWNPINLLTGNSIWSQIVDQYINICSNYDFEAAANGRPDKIYLFGFSRGAMAVRALASLIAEFGLLKPRNIRQLPMILDAWNRTVGKTNLSKEVKVVDAEVEFVGLFDSVMGGVEWLRLFNPIRFSNFKVPPRCRQAVQILAIDENRRFFRPKHWDGIAEWRSNPAFQSKRMLRQIWMPGVHSDIGGTGNPFWGNAAFLAMAYFIRTYTDLALQDAELARKESKFRSDALDDARFAIEPHRGLGTKFYRTPFASEHAGQSGHPVCDPMNDVTYGRRRQYAWQDNIYSKRFNLRIDAELKTYFDGIVGRNHHAPVGSDPDRGHAAPNPDAS